MTKKTKLLNPMKIRGEEYKGFAVDMKHGLNAQRLAKKEGDLKKIQGTNLRSEEYKGFAFE